MYNVGFGSISMLELATAIASLVGKPGAVRSIPLDVARQRMPFADGISLQQQVLADGMLDQLGWKPTGPSLQEELTTGSYRLA